MAGCQRIELCLGSFGGSQVPSTRNQYVFALLRSCLPPDMRRAGPFRIPALVALTAYLRETATRLLLLPFDAIAIRAMIDWKGTRRKGGDWRHCPRQPLQKSFERRDHHVRKVVVAAG